RDPTDLRGNVLKSSFTDPVERILPNRRFLVLLRWILAGHVDVLDDPRDEVFCEGLRALFGGSGGAAGQRGRGDRACGRGGEDAVGSFHGVNSMCALQASSRSRRRQGPSGIVSSAVPDSLRAYSLS